MRVCFLIGNFPVYSGVSSQAVLQAEELLKIGVSVELGIIAGSNEVFVCSDIFDPKRLPESLTYFFLHPLQGSLASVKKYIEFFRRMRREFDVVHFHGLPAGYAMMVPILKMLGLRVVIKMTGMGINDPLSIRENVGWFSSRVFSMADAVIGTSQALRDAYITAGFSEKKLSAIPNGVDCSRFFPPRDAAEKARLKEKLNIAPDTQIALFVGSFRTAKGADLLIDSFCKVKDSFKNLQLVIVGPLCPVCPGGKNSEKSLMESIKTSLRIILHGKEIIVLGKDTNRFSLVGPMRNVEEWMRAADVFLFPSRREGLPNVVLEAMATALPCITLNIPEITGDLLVEDSLGWCVEDNTSAFSKAFFEVISNPRKAEKCGENALLRAKSIFSSEKVAEKIKSLYMGF